VIPQKNAPKRPFWRFGALLFLLIGDVAQIGGVEICETLLIEKTKGDVL
jgi:hypothetical protein